MRVICRHCTRTIEQHDGVWLHVRLAHAKSAWTRWCYASGRTQAEPLVFEEES